MQTNLVIKMDDELVKIFQSICMVRRTTMTEVVNILVKEVFLTQIKSDEEGFATLSQEDLEKIITGNFDDELETFTCYKHITKKIKKTLDFFLNKNNKEN